MIGTEIAKMHLADVIHGDLTTSNMMLRRPTPSAESNLVRPDELSNFSARCLILYSGPDRLRTGIYICTRRRQGCRSLRSRACLLFDASRF
jgi:hypothetical protein